MIHALPRLAWGLAGAVALGAAAPAVAAPSPSPNAVRAKAAEIFNRSEFNAGSVEDNAILRALHALVTWLGALSGAAPVLFWLFLIVIAGLLVAIVVYALVSVRRSFGGGSRGSRRGDHAQRIALSAGYRQDAERLAAAGDYTEAVRFLFLSLVYRFDEQGRVSLHVAYTNREYLLLLGESSPARAALRVMVDTLDDHWYGQRACERTQYDECLAIYLKLLGGK